jgi:hypothetical protein
MLEALACGTTDAGFPVAAKRDVVGDAPVAVLDEDLHADCPGAGAVARDARCAFAETMTGDDSARRFLANLERRWRVAPTPALDALKATASRPQRKTQTAVG